MLDADPVPFCPQPYLFIYYWTVDSFFIVHRLPLGKSGARGRKSVHLINLSIFIMAVTMSSFIGFIAYLLIQLPVVMMAAISRGIVILRTASM